MEQLLSIQKGALFIKKYNKSFNIDRFYTPRRYRSALCKTVKLIQTLYCKNKKMSIAVFIYIKQ